VNDLEVQADLLSADAANVRANAVASITGWGGPQPIRARVRRVEPAAFTKVSALGLEEQRVRVVLDLVDKPPKALGHNYRVDAAIAVWEGRDVVRVPSTALFRAGDRWAVFLARAGRARKTLVDPGMSDGTWTAVSGGVGDGETVIVQPSDAIADGTRISER
jgi:HlyD family secretion protein